MEEYSTRPRPERSERGAARTGSRNSGGGAARASASGGAAAARTQGRAAPAGAGTRGGTAPAGARPAGRPPGRGRTPSAPAKRYTVQAPGELLAFLLQALKGEGRNSVKAMLARGQVSVNGRAVTAYNYELLPGHTVAVSAGKAAPEEAPLVGLKILHEDRDLLVVQKEAGLLSIATEQEKEVTAYRQLTAHVRRQDPNARIFIVHRLDRDTSGVMLFAKSESIQQQLQDNWKTIVKERTYTALVEGLVKKPEGTISSWLKESKTLKMYSSPTPNDGQHAVTHYKVRLSNKQFTLLDVTLETGRKNQIRVHMEDIGHPIVGDKKYGARSASIGRLGLHARVLAFTHPTTGKAMRFETAIPKPLMRPFKDAPQ
ncbi:RluA family pseudouridine synthase [Paenibacillus koleovorans]|uniref:RluA family pseudouridine synthase n=1 Tax=Paenibacillus koleovorans TaxID=121608 RepID=UPI0035A23AD1